MAVAGEGRGAAYLPSNLLLLLFDACFSSADLNLLDCCAANIKMVEQSKAWLSGFTGLLDRT